MFPLFFQLSGRIYHEREAPIWDSGGSLAVVPLPVSMLACVAGLLLLIRAWRRAQPEILIAAAFVIAMLVAAVASGGLEPRKLVLLAQFALPCAALVLGALLLAEDHVPAARVWMVLVPVLIVFQLYFSYQDEGMLTLHHSMRVFSIYQNRQYVPTVFIAAYAVALFALWDRPWGRVVAWVTAPALALYAVISLSFLTIGLLAMTVALLVLVRPRSPAAWLVLALTLAASVTGSALIRAGATGTAGTAAVEKFSVLDAPSGQPAPERTAAPMQIGLPFGLPSLRVPVNITQRIGDWSLYGRGIVETPATLLVGHAQPMDRKLSTSAHNYYLDLVYTFGVLGLLPFLALCLYTVRLLWRRRTRLGTDLALLGLALAVVFFVVADNNFKVTLRQPYPGLFAYFLWGLLLARLRHAAAGTIAAPTQVKDGKA